MLIFTGWQNAKRFLKQELRCATITIKNRSNWNWRLLPVTLLFRNQAIILLYESLPSSANVSNANGQWLRFHIAIAAVGFVTDTNPTEFSYETYNLPITSTMQRPNPYNATPTIASKCDRATSYITLSVSMTSPRRHILRSQGHGDVVPDDWWDWFVMNIVTSKQLHVARQTMSNKHRQQITCARYTERRCVDVGAQVAQVFSYIWSLTIWYNTRLMKVDFIISPLFKKNNNDENFSAMSGKRLAISSPGWMNGGREKRSMFNRVVNRTKLFERHALQ